MDDILADNCHINPDTPKLEKSAVRTALDWAATTAQDAWSTVTNVQAMKQIGTGVINQVKDHPVDTLKDVGIGIAARAAGVLAAVPAASYLIGREGAMLALKGPDAAADDTTQLVTAPFKGIGKAAPAAQVLSNPDSTQTQRTAANSDLQSAGASIVPPLAMGVGGASGDLGPQILRGATSGARNAAMEIGRASFGDTLGLEPAYANVGQLPVKEIAGIAKGSPSIPTAVAAGEATVVFSQNTGGDGGGRTENGNGHSGDTDKTETSLEPTWKRPDNAPDNIEYESGTRKIKSEHWTSSNGATQRMEYDVATGKPKFLDKAWRNGTTEHSEYAVSTGNCKFTRRTKVNGDTKYTEYDLTTGKRKLEIIDETYYDSPGRGYRRQINSRGHEEKKYDPVTGNITSREFTRSTGWRERTEYDPATGNRKFTEMIDGPPAGRGTKVYSRYNGNTEKLESWEETFPNGSRSRIEYDSNTGVAMFRDDINPDGSGQHMVFDSKGFHQLVEKVEADGSIERTEYNPITQHVIVHDRNMSTVRAVRLADLPGARPLLISHEEFDAVTGNRKLWERTYYGGTKEYEEIDPITGRDILLKRTNRDGSENYGQRDPDTGAILWNTGH